MLRTISVVREVIGAAVTAPAIYAIGNNAGLVFTMTSAGGGQYSADRSPWPDRMMVNSFAGTVTDVNSRFAVGARLGLGLLTGDKDNPVHFLKFGIVGTDGDMWVHVPYTFKTDFGLCLYFAEYYSNANWFFKASATYRVPPLPARGIDERSQR